MEYTSILVSVLGFTVLLIPSLLGGILIILTIKALLKYIRTQEIRQERTILRKSLAQVLKEERTKCRMTQEFVAETLGVSRQAVSKWETGRSDPSTSNLMELARLYGISAEDLIHSVQASTHGPNNTDEKDN